MAAKKPRPKQTKLINRNKDLIRLGFDATVALRERQAAGDLGERMRHDIETLRNMHECVFELVEMGGEWSDSELAELAARLDRQLRELEERAAAGKPN
jgi:hypothetical protein